MSGGARSLFLNVNSSPQAVPASHTEPRVLYPAGAPVYYGVDQRGLTVSNGTLVTSGLTVTQQVYLVAAGIATVEVLDGAVIAGGTALPTGGTAGQVLTKQSGTDGDAVWTSVSGTAAPGVYRPEDYGAIGDGTQHLLSERYGTVAAAQAVYPFVTTLIDWTLDQAAIQKCINLANANPRGGDVVLSGDYYGVHIPTAMASWGAHPSILMRSNVTLRGVGAARYQVPWHNSTTTAYCAIGTVSRARDWCIRDLRMSTDSVGRPGAERPEFAINLENDGVQRWRIENVDFERFGGHRIMAYATYSTNEDDMITDWQIKGCRSRLCKNVSVALGLCKRGVIQGNFWFDSDVGECIVVGAAGDGPCERISIIGNTCYGTLHIDTSRDCTVQGNLLKDEPANPLVDILMRIGGPSSGTGWDHTSGTGCSGIVVSGNTFECRGTGCRAIDAFKGSNYVIADNIIHKSGGDSQGINVQSAVDGLHIHDNIFEDPAASTGNDISITSCTGLNIHDNTCKSTAVSNSISIATSPEAKIHDNRCSMTIRVEDCDDCAVESNRISGAMGSAISIVGATTRAFVGLNRIKNTQAAAIGVNMAANPGFVFGNVVNMTGASSPKALQSGTSSATTKYDKNYIVAGGTGYRTGDVVDGVTQP
jgi:hypothetical protein